jgi:hypothetical protein
MRYCSSIRNCEITLSRISRNSQQVIPLFPFRFKRLRMALRLHLMAAHRGEGSHEFRAHEAAANPSSLRIRATHDS